MILIRKTMSGTVVGNVQQLLAEAGYTILQTELVAQVFGDSTFEAVRAFQASHLDSNGNALVSDGIVGAETFWALQHPGEPSGARENYYTPGWYYHPEDARSYIRSVLDYACSKIGVYEDPDGSNDGHDVREFTSPGYIGEPWCALFASVAYDKLPTASPFGRIAATWALYDWGQAHNLVLSAETPAEPGDLLLLLRGAHNDPKHHGHTMIAVGREAANGRIYTVAGNESNAVRGGVRMRGDLSAVIRPA
jgi:hypothetical protein